MSGDSNFIVKNTLVVNGAFTANSTQFGIGSTAVINSTAVSVGSSVINSSAIAVGGVVSINSTAITVGSAFNANTSGVNAVAIATSTNTATIGTASYFVSNGNFGLGTASPAYKLDVSGTGRFQNNVWLSYTGTNPWRISNLTGNFYINYNDNTNYLSIIPGTGFVFSANIVSNSSLVANGSSGSAGQVLTSNGSGTYWGSSFNNATLTGNTQINSLGVGTAASGVTGEIRATNNITGYYSSDESLKENITIIPNALDKVKSIRGVEFDWTDAYIEENGGEDGYFIRKHDVGVIAQEIEKVLPEVVATREDGTKAVKYDRVVALLIQAIKELEEKVNTGCNCGCK